MRQNKKQQKGEAMYIAVRTEKNQYKFINKGALPTKIFNFSMAVLAVYGFFDLILPK